jgi:glycosyltransferase involved in cell wall biosynthesis
MSQTLRPRISIVTPAYNEAGSLPALHERLCHVLGPAADWELIVVNDGSTDDTWRVVDGLNERDPRVRGIHLLLNSGHMKALIAGLDHADGDLVITMDADLQHPPELIPEIVERWKTGAMVVNTIRRETAHESLLKRITSRAYYQIFRSITGIPIRPGMADFRGIDRRVVALVREYKEEALPVRFLLAKLPFPSAELEYVPAPRFAGATKYTYRKMMAFAAESLFSFSLAPLYFGYLLGFVFLALFTIYALYVLYVRLVLNQGIEGWSSQILITLMASAVQFLLLGILGGYVGAISREVKHRPRYVVGGRTGFDGPQRTGETARSTES